jgi:predicted nucleic acid-binding protein
MKNFVLDANIIFSSLLSGKQFYRKLFENYEFYTPDFALNEIQNYQEQILKKTKLNKQDLQEFTLFIFSKLVVVPEFYISNEARQKAYDLCKDIDLKDIIYVALSIEINFTLITRDKQLYNGLIEKGFNNVRLFDEFLNEVNSQSNLFKLE